MSRISRRAALSSLSGLALTACGGGDDSLDAEASEAGADAPAPAGAAVPPSVAQPDNEVAVAAAAVGPATADAKQFLVWDAGSGPSSKYWSRHLQLAWKNEKYGDWIDAAGKAQGTTPFSSTPVTAGLKWFEFNGTVLVERWRRSGENKGFTLRAVATSKGTPSIYWAGRQSTTPPLLRVTLKSGARIDCPCLAFASYAETSKSGIDSRQSVRTMNTIRAVLQFDLSKVTSEVASATVRLYCLSKSTVAASIESYECSPPRFQLAGAQTQPLLGLAASVGEANLAKHADVLRAGDFSNLKLGTNNGGLFDSLGWSEFSSNEQLPDPDAPGSVMFRGSFTPEGRGSFNGDIELMRANYNDPLRPPAKVETEMFCRLYVFLEDDWRSTRDANKMAIGWDLQMGWWNDAQGGYWQSTTGNGGVKGTGLKKFAPAKSLASNQKTDRWVYEGHSIRMEAGLGTDDGNPYEDLRPLQDYVYNIDQPTNYGDMFRLGAAVLKRGRWHCLEQQIRVNSITGPYDGLGNGTAVADGLLRTWVDGVLVSELTGIRWRRHPEMGVQGVWIDWYYGGTQATERVMHYRMNHLVVARKYIGPRRI